MRLTTPAFACLLSLGCALPGSPLCAQDFGEPVIRIRQNDLIPNLGTVQSLTRIAISDSGVLFTEITILENNLRYMMRNNFATFANNLPLPEPGPPADYTMRGTFANFELDEKTNVAWRLQTSNTNGMGTGLAGNHTAIYYNLKLIHNDLDSAHTLAGVQNPYFPGTDISNWTYAANGFSGVYASSDGRLLINCRVDSNGVSNGGALSNALILVEIDAVGNILKETLVALESSSALNTDIGTVFTTSNSYHLGGNDNWIGTFLYDSIAGTGTSGGNDGAVAVNDPTNIIFREGTTVPGVGQIISTGTVAGRTSINSYGQTAVMLRFTGNIDHIISEGVEIASEGSESLNLASLAPDTVANLETNPPLRITDMGDVYWTARLTGVSGQNRVFMRNQEVIVRRGVSMIDDTLIRDIRTNERAYTVSNSGRFWAGQIQLGGGGDDAIVLMDFGLVLPILGRDTNPSSIRRLDGDARLGDRLVLSMDDSQGPGSVPIVYFSTRASLPGNPLGIQTNFGELFINTTPGILLSKITGSPVTSGASSVAVNIPANIALVDFEIYAQGLFFDQGASNGGPVFSLTNGLYMVIGAS